MRLRTILPLLLGAALLAPLVATGALGQATAPSEPKGAPAPATTPAPTPAPAALAPLGHADMLAHRAAYRLTLDRARENSDVARVEGAMLFEVVDACDGWATRQRMTMTLIDRDGQQIETTSDYSTYETKDGRRLRFSLTQMTQGAVTQRVSGEAELGGDGSGVVNYVDPNGKQERLPAATMLPMGHTVAAVNAARAGQRLLVGPLFDGTSPDGAQDTTTVISRWQEGGSSDRFSVLNRLGSARMRIAFFDRTPNDTRGGASAPDYEVGLRYWQNGVADELKMDFGDFTVTGEMLELQPVPGGC